MAEVSEELAESVFAFNDREALQVQDDGICATLQADFWERMLHWRAGVTRLPVKLLKQVKLSYSQLHWLANYGAVVVVRPLDSKHSSIILVGLDGWKFTVHASVTKRESTAVADVTAPAVFDFGRIITDDVERVLLKLKEALFDSERDSKAENRRQRQRHQGNQKTPSFVRALLQQLMMDSDTPLPVQGGTSDVGLHTGCIRRNTSFPLVLSAVHTLLRLSGQESDDVFHKCVVIYYLSYLQDTVRSVTKFDARKIDRAVLIIRQLEAQLDSVKSDSFVDRVADIIKEYHDRLVDLRPGGEMNWRVNGGKKAIVFEESVAEICKRLKAPELPSIPELSREHDDPMSKVDQARSDARENLALSKLGFGSAAQKLEDNLVEIGRLNSFFWKIATEFDNAFASHTVSELRSKLKHFSKGIKVAKKLSLETTHVMTVVLSSYELLATWICYCCAHRTAEIKCPILQSYGVALDASDLRHIVLDEARALTAVQCVRLFLGARSGRPCRPFRIMKDTLKLALEYGRSSPLLCDMHDSELQKANLVIEERWGNVKQTQRELAELDTKLHGAKRDLWRATIQRQESEKRDFDWDRNGKKCYRSQFYEADRHEDNLQQLVNSLKDRIRFLETKPPPLNLGLPIDKDQSLQWLFFLFMPAVFRDLSTLAHSAQSKLWKTPPTSNEDRPNLLTWYGSNRKHLLRSPTEGSLLLLTCSKLPRSRVSTPGIRLYDRRTGITFADSFSVDPTWKGTDPFVQGRDDNETTLLFTEPLPSQVHKSQFMQKFVAMLPTKTRENEVLAWQESKPEWLSQEQYVAFATMRVGPCAQIRCLATALQESLLPFSHVCVHIIVKMLLFQIGEEHWKADFLNGFQGFEQFSFQMRRKIDLLRESPKDCDSLLLFGILSSFLGQYDPGCRNCAREFARISRRWADNVRMEVEKNDKMTPAHYRKQSKLYGYALVCLSLGAWTPGRLEDLDYLEMAELIVLFHNKAIFASDDTQSDSLVQMVMHVMASRFEIIVSAVRRNVNHLTRCISLIVDNVPLDLQWSPVDYEEMKGSSCFEAETADGDLYSVNLLNGTVLVNGAPLGLLPSSVTQDLLYCRTFGKRNFEMKVDGFRCYRTAQFVDGFYLYKFVVDSTDSLHIFEVDTSTDSELMLMRETSALTLPPLLREQYSHWISEEHMCVVLRKHSYGERLVDYVITKEATYCLPPESRKADVHQVMMLVPTYDRLVLGESYPSKTMSRFEHEEYIHITVNPEQTELHYTLPRYKLSFALKDRMLSSGEFKGFCMEDARALDDTLPGLRSFIVLAHRDGREKVLICDGTIVEGGNVNIPIKWHTQLSFHIFDIHPRFRHLVAVNTIARLHLAGLYAASACAVNDRRMGKPGAVVATTLVRQSWKNEPFTVAESAKLREIEGHSRLSCTLYLICAWLRTSSNSVIFLHETEESSPGSLDLDRLALDEYRLNVLAPRLLPCEEWTLLGTRQPTRVVVRRPQLNDSETLAFVRETERQIRDQCLVEKRTLDSSMRSSFPLSRPLKCTKLERNIYMDIEESYKIFCSLPLKKIGSFDAKSLGKIQEEVTLRRDVLESAIKDRLTERGARSRNLLSQLSGRSGIATILDILRCIYDDSIPLSFNPSLDLFLGAHLGHEAVEWGVLCVLEDRLSRIFAAYRQKDTHSLLIELSCVREWSPTQHSRWLAFEVEQQLQIRQHQFGIVKQLFDNPGSVIQLNMGLGKTRVLVPMLILDLMATASIARVNVLQAILAEALEYYRTVLVASVQHVKLFTLPFHRGIELNSARGRQLSDEIERCAEHLGCFVVSPQHRNSLLLQQYDAKVYIKGLKETTFVDILDESDAILSHEFQLVYALGTQVPLPSGQRRWTVLQSLLYKLARSKNEDLLRFTNDPILVHRENSSCGSFPKLRLLLPFKGKERTLGTILCSELLASPPYELRWMQNVRANERKLLLLIMTEPALRTVSETIDSIPLFKKEKSDILSVRGFIAYGLLFHGLEGRYRVNYGLKTGSKVKMAVPYAASDTPKKRAQYSHPDTQLVYTALSYFHEGITESQLKDALICLQQMGPAAQRSIYNEWIDGIREDVPPEELVKFDDIRKIDNTNKLQLKAIHGKLGLSMEAICFWTNNFVYPAETYQFLSKRASSAWNLCDSGMALGFSGTDDSRFLLPLSVSQLSPRALELQATNGAMVNRILDSTKSIRLLNDLPGVPLWQEVLSQCIELGAAALIDVGGLMAGSRNEEAAMYLAQRLQKKQFRGVVFYDVNYSAWMVLQSSSLAENRRLQSLQSSSLTEEECFVYFDESRCRGSDMKLRTNATGVVSLESKLSKDKFLQGCARMRKLHRNGQSLVLAGTAEVVAGNVTCKSVLEKILHQTASVTKKGLLTYYHRGLNYASFPSPIEDDISLEAMYGKCIADQEDLGEYIDAMYEGESAEKLVQYCKEIGQGMVVGSMATISEECEQELENEVEHEAEEEMKIAQQVPSSQLIWPWPRAFTDPESLFRDLTFMPLAVVIRKILIPSVAGIKWPDNLYCTQNFWAAIEGAAKTDKNLSLYARPVNSVLVMSDGRIVLLSIYELDRLLPEWWRTNTSSKKPRAVLQHLSMLEEGPGFGHDSVAISHDVLAFLKLFQGYVQYPEEQKKVLLTAVCKGNLPNALNAVQDLLRMRNRLHFLERSDLEMIASSTRP